HEASRPEPDPTPAQLVDDIRGPLAAIRGDAQLLRRRVTNADVDAATLAVGFKRIEDPAPPPPALLGHPAALPAPESEPSLTAYRAPAEIVQLSRGVEARRNF